MPCLAPRPRLAAARALAAALLLALLAACGSPEEKAAAHAARGVALYEAGDDAKAMIEFRNALRIDPKNADVLYHVGLIHERAERWPQAVAAFRAAAAERPGFKAANLELGTLALTAGEIDLAERAAKAILDRRPDDPDGLALDAAVLLRRGDLQRAQDVAQAVLAEHPDHENATAVRVGVLGARGRLEAAVALLEEALARRPASAPLWLLKIALLEQRGEVEAVVAAYERLFAIDPGNAGYRLALADFHRRRDDLGGAEAVLRAALDGGVGTATMGRALAELVYRERGLAAAEAEIARLLARRPDDHALRFLLADFYAEEDRLAEAERVLREVIARAAGGPIEDAKAGLARLALARGDREAAKGLLAEVLAGNAEHRGANFVLGLVHLAESRFDEALRSARTALRRDPAWLPGLRLVAESHLRAGEIDLALDALREVVALDPTDAVAAEMLATQLTRRGDLDAALKIWDRLVALAENPAPALAARARIRIRQANWAAARGDIERLLATPEGEAVGARLAGDLLIAQNRFREGREWFGRALVLAPEADEPLIGIVRSYLAEDDPAGALAYLEERLARRPGDALAHHMRGDLLARRGDLDAAEAAFHAAIRARPDWRAPYRRLAAALREAGRLEAAIAVHAEGLARRPDDPDLLMDLAAAQLDGERFAEAIATYARLLEVQPASDLAANNYAALVADHRHEDEAALEAALEVARRFRTSTNPWFLDTLGWLHYRRGDFPVAAAFLERAVGLRPEEHQFRYHLGMALYRSGQKERARVELALALREGAAYPGVEEARTVLAALEAETAPPAPGG